MTEGAEQTEKAKPEWTEKHLSVVRFALLRFLPNAEASAKWAAQQENPNVFHWDVKIIKECVRMLEASPPSTQAELTRLRAIEHHAWHLLDESMSEGSGDNEVITIDTQVSKMDLDALHELLPEEHPSMAEDASNLCSDCPPADYPTDKTRCLPCPRRDTPAQADPKPAADEAHTAEPWFEGHPGYGDGGGKFFPIYGADHVEVLGESMPTDADRRRIVACVNACAGIPTEEMEAGEYERHIIETGMEIGRLQAQREQLLAALSRIARLCARRNNASANNIEDIAVAAITAVGGAV